MLDLLVGMEMARRRTEELLAYDERARGKARVLRGDRSRLGRAVSLLGARIVGRGVERSPETATARPRRAELARRRAS